MYLAHYRVLGLGNWMDQSSLELLIKSLCRGEIGTLDGIHALEMLGHAKELELVDDAGIPTSSFAHLLLNSLWHAQYLFTNADFSELD